MSIAIDSEGRKTMVATGRVSRRSSHTTVFTGEHAPAVITIAPAIHPDCVIITGTARSAEIVTYPEDGPSNARLRSTEGALYDLYITPEHALALAESLTRAARAALGVSR